MWNWVAERNCAQVSWLSSPLSEILVAAQIPWTFVPSLGNENFRKKHLSLSSTMLKLLTVWLMTNFGKLLERWEHQTSLPVSWETCVWVKRQQLEPRIEQLIGSRLRKEYNTAVCRHPVCLTYTLSTSWETPGWMSYKLESRLLGEITTSDRWYHSNDRKWRGTKEPLDEGKKGEWKSWLKTQH